MPDTTAPIAESQSAADAANHGVEMRKALKWVSTPETSRHVQGTAVDIGPTDADSWLSLHSSDYGLCQIYANEPWHFERVTEPGGACPDLITDAASVPR